VSVMPTKMVCMKLEHKVRLLLLTQMNGGNLSYFSSCEPHENSFFRDETRSCMSLLIFSCCFACCSVRCLMTKQKVGVRQTKEQPPNPTHISEDALLVLHELLVAHSLCVLINMLHFAQQSSF